MRDRTALMAELKNIEKEMNYLYDKARKNHTYIYAEEINKLLARERNIKTNLNQIKMKEMNER